MEKKDKKNGKASSKTKQKSKVKVSELKDTKSLKKSVGGAKQKPGCVPCFGGN